MNQEKIGKFISEKRKGKKLTQAELAEKLGVTNRSISNWENGKNMPDLSLFKPLCKILDITINELMSGENIKDLDYKNKFEENIIHTIDYIDKKKEKNNDIKNISLLLLGILGLCLNNFVFNDIELQNYVNVICMILSIYSIKQLFTKHIFVRKILALILIITYIFYLIL